MNPHKKPKSLQDILKQRQQSGFVGREAQISLFRKNLKLPLDDDSRCFVFNIWGQGGVGKSTLVRQFRKIAEEANIVTAYTDETEKNVPGVMGRLAEQLEQQGHKLGQFTERYKVFRQKQQELQSDPEAPQGLTAFLGRTMVKTGVRIARHIPGTDVVMEFIDEDAISKQAGEWASFVAKKLTNKDEVRLVQEPIKVLTPLFLADVCKIAAKSGIALFFDTYERSEGFLDGWLKDVLDGRYGEVPLNIIITIAGRQELDKNHWASYEGLIARLPMNPFTEEEARQYLTRKNITNPQVIDVILHLSGRLPLLVATLAAETPNDPSKVGDPSGTAVERFLKWVEDPKRRQVALDAALPRCLNRDILAHLEGDEIADELFDWLKQVPFVEERTDGWAYHDIVKTQMLRHKRLTSPRSWAHLHGKLADYYDMETESEAWSDEWQTYKLNFLYHRLCQSPQKYLAIALNEFLAALKNKLAFAKLWAEIILQVGKDTDVAEILRWGERLTTGLKAYDEHRYETALSMFTDLLNNPIIEAKWHSVAFNWRGYVYYLAKEYSKALENQTKAIDLGPPDAVYFAERGNTLRLMERYEEALQDFDKAIELDPKYDSAIASRGKTYRLMQRYTEAIADFDQAIELHPKYTWAIANRGETYRLIKRYQEALNDFDKAIEVDPKYAWAMRMRSWAYLMLKRYQEALIDFNNSIYLEADDDWCLYLRGLTLIKLNQADKGKLDIENAMAIAKHKYNENTKNWCNTLNLALYYLVAGNFDTSKSLYQFALHNHASSERISAAIRDLDDLLNIFPDYVQAQQMRQLLQSTAT
jgi:tetratricopeptide (TPR) repeat protein